MKNLKSSESCLISAMRWTARLLAVPWSLWALFSTLFVLGHLVGAAGIFGIAMFGLVVVAFPPLSIGAAFAASIWRKEEIGGKVLLFDGILMLGLTAWVFDPHSPWVAVTGFWTMVVPPLVAGALFLTCHRKLTKQEGISGPESRASHTET